MTLHTKQVSYIIVDDIPNDLPPLEKDVYFDKPVGNNIEAQFCLFYISIALLSKSCLYAARYIIFLRVTIYMKKYFYLWEATR